MDNKLKMEALQKLLRMADFDDLKKKAKARSQKVVDKYKDSNPVKAEMDAVNDGYDITHEGMTQEEKELSAEQEYRAKRKEIGLE